MPLRHGAWGSAPTPSRDYTVARLPAPRYPSPNMPHAMVIRAAGTNCDAEMVRAFQLAGAAASLVHLDTLITDPRPIDDADLLGFPGGFSYGDDIASGRIFAMKVRERLYPALRAAVERGCCIIGACNGFQVLVQAGLLPGPDPGEPWPASPPAQRLALSDNINASFHDAWIEVVPEQRSRCVWTRSLAELASRPGADDVVMLPVAHGEGRLVADSPDTLDRLAASGQIVLKYRHNFNGSERSVAGVCDASGRVFGLMPHPERYLEWTRHPFWTRLPADIRRGPAPGMLVFHDAVEAVSRVHA